MSADESPTTTRGPHPAHCRACAGTGWVEGATLTTRVGGRDIKSPALARCEHDWWYDEPVLPEPLPPGDPRAHAALARGLAEGIAERERAAQPEPEQTRLDL